MFCTHCGNEIEQHANFCSKCGQQIVGPAPVQAPQQGQPTKKAPHDMQMHITILGWLFIGSGILTGLIAFVIIFIGQVIMRSPVPFPPDVPIGTITFISWILAMVGLGMTALAAGTAAAGVGLLQYRNWGRGLTVVMSVFMLFHFPIGTGIGIYAFWVLFSEEGREYYKSRSVDTITVSGI